MPLPLLARRPAEVDIGLVVDDAAVAGEEEEQAVEECGERRPAMKLDPSWFAAAGGDPPAWRRASVRPGADSTRWPRRTGAALPRPAAARPVVAGVQWRGVILFDGGWSAARALPK
jgi:hypothetical protein